MKTICNCSCSTCVRDGGHCSRTKCLFTKRDVPVTPPSTAMHENHKEMTPAEKLVQELTRFTWGWMNQFIPHSIRVGMVKLAESYLAAYTWRTAVEEACVVSHIDFYPDDPRKTLANIITWNVSVALDPAVSERAPVPCTHCGGAGKLRPGAHPAKHGKVAHRA